MAKRKPVTTLLRDIQTTQPSTRRSELGTSLNAVAERLIEGLASESEQQRRRFTVLRRSDVLGQSHAEIARDVGLSRSQFYRDLHEARELFSSALEREFSTRAATPGLLEPGVATQRVTIEMLRNGGQLQQAREATGACLRAAGPAEAVDLLCLRAELERECADFASARQTTAQARALLPQIAEERERDLLAVTCELADFEWAHSQGTPADPARREACLADMRRRYAAGDRAYATLLVKALVGETSLRFGRGDDLRALTEEASALVRREPSVDARLAVDVQVRAAAAHALRPDGLSTAMEETARIIEAGMRWRDAQTLWVGLQSMSSHLLTLGRLDEAKEYALQARSLVELFGNSIDRLVVLSMLARIDVHRRDGAQALRWIALAHDTGYAAFPITQAISISEAEALALIDRPVPALASARATEARVQHWPRLHARAKLAEAIALSTLASNREAQWCSNEALELSRAAGGPLVELRALDLNVRLTGDAASRRALRDLRARLRSPKLINPS